MSFGEAKTLREFAQRFQGLADRIDKNAGLAIRIAADIAASDAKKSHGYTDRSSNLTNSISFDGPRGSFKSNTLESLVSAGAGYAVYVEKGTRKHDIKPKHRKALRWPVKGGFRFSRKGVKHPGTKPYRFLEGAVKRVTPTLKDKLIPEAVELSFVEIGFKRGK